MRHEFIMHTVICDRCETSLGDSPFDSLRILDKFFEHYNWLAIGTKDYCKDCHEVDEVQIKVGDCFKNECLGDFPYCIYKLVTEVDGDCVVSDRVRVTDGKLSEYSVATNDAVDRFQGGNPFWKPCDPSEFTDALNKAIARIEEVRDSVKI